MTILLPPLPEPVGKILYAGPYHHIRQTEGAFDADQMREYAAAVSAADNAALRAELAKHQESEFHPDWSLLVATRDSLAEHQQMIVTLRQYLDAAQRRAGALGDEVAGLREALKSADAAFESVEVYMPDNCPQEFAFYASWEEVRAALKGEA
jgi:predicted metal-dependent phosphoesterase TrpH